MKRRDVSPVRKSHSLKDPSHEPERAKVASPEMITSSTK
jgi:hypothetical protein